MQLRSKTDVTQHIKSINFTFEIHYQNVISSQHDSDMEILSLFANFFLYGVESGTFSAVRKQNSCALTSSMMSAHAKIFRFQCKSNKQ
jgi:hypothetical protein